MKEGESYKASLRHVTETGGSKEYTIPVYATACHKDQRNIQNTKRVSHSADLGNIKTVLCTFHLRAAFASAKQKKVPEELRFNFYYYLLIDHSYSSPHLMCLESG